MEATATDLLEFRRDMETRNVWERVVVECLSLGRQVDPEWSLFKLAQELSVDPKAIRKWRAGEAKPTFKNGLDLILVRDALRRQVHEKEGA